jgi:signal transduction histidine kinase
MDIGKLSVIKLFEGLDREDIAHIAQDLHAIKITAGKSVICEHEHGDCLYIILSGKVEISKELTENDESLMASLKVLEPGDFFGEMSLLDNQPRSANAIAQTDAQLLLLPKEKFFQLSVSHPTVMFNLIRTLSWRLRDTNQRFIDMMDQLIKQNRLMAVGMAASKIIHDIKTPLTVIVLTAQLIEKLYPESGEFSESIVSQTKMIDQMVREILDYAKGNPTPISPHKVNLPDFLGDIRELMQHTTEGRDIDFVIENRIQGDVWFDESKIRRVLINLIKNSTESLKEKGYIRIDALIEDNFLTLIVSDNGLGVPAKLRPRMFSPFQSEGKAHGTGLGLAICQKIVHEHHGTIDYHDNEPHGAIFIIRLPQPE